MDDKEFADMIEHEVEDIDVQRAVKERHDVVTAHVKKVMSRATATVVPAGASVSLLEISSRSSGSERSYERYLKKLAYDLNWSDPDKTYNIFMAS